MTANSNEESVRWYWTEVWGKGNVAAAAEFYAPRYRENGVELTPEEFVEGAGAWLAHFEDVGVEIEKLFSSGDMVVSRVTYRATNTGDFKAVPATGKKTEVTGIDIFEFEDGRVVDHWHEADHLLLFQQLGAELRPKES